MYYILNVRAFLSMKQSETLFIPYRTINDNYLMDTSVLNRVSSIMTKLRTVVEGFHNS